MLATIFLSLFCSTQDITAQLVIPHSPEQWQQPNEVVPIGVDGPIYGNDDPRLLRAPPSPPYGAFEPPTVGLPAAPLYDEQMGMPGLMISDQPLDGTSAISGRGDKKLITASGSQSTFETISLATSTGVKAKMARNERKKSNKKDKVRKKAKTTSAEASQSLWSEQPTASSLVESESKSVTMNSKGNSPVDIVRYTQQQPSKQGLIPGEVFGLVTLSSNPSVDQETVVIYRDGTLGVKEPTFPGYLFEGLLLPDYGLLLAPEPLTTVKLNDQKVLFLNDSLFNPSPLFSADGWDLKTHGGRVAVCPSWNSVLTFVPDTASPPCLDAVDVDLRIVPIAGDI